MGMETAVANATAIPKRTCRVLHKGFSRAMNRIKWKFYIIPMLLVMLVPLLLAATSNLPPRPTPEPTKSKQPGAYIQLQLSGASVGSDGVWTVVQWVDASDEWHDVTGWQGTVEQDGTQTWWVAPNDKGAGPFRWQILSSPTGSILATSDEFMLPDETGHKLIVPIEVE